MCRSGRQPVFVNRPSSARPRIGEQPDRAPVAGRSVSPVWTGPAWTIVLAGATSQWKRSDCGSCGDRAALRLAVGDVLDRLQQRLDLGRRRTSATARPAAPRRVACGRRGSAAGGRRSTTPALTASPRSTRGTTRSAAYWNGLTRPGTLGLLAHRAGPRAGWRGTPRTARRRPSRRDERGAPRRVGRGARRASASSIEPANEQHVVADRGEALAHAPPGSPGTWCTTSRAVVRSATARRCQRSRFGVCAGVRSTLSTSASNTRRRRLCSGLRAAARW
jgi:hypothetical protein